MKERVNVAELLKNCPKGMELDCTMYEDVYFDYVDELKIIHCYIQHNDFRTSITFNQHGTYNSNIKSKCVIFPKGKTTWEGFQPPFKDGDIVAYDNPHRDNLQLFIFKDKKENNTLSTCYMMLDGDELDLEEGMYYVTRLATEEEKQKLFDAIKANGYKWNTETRTLEKLIKPKFKVGDKVRYKDDKTVITITGIKDNYYFIQFYSIRKRDYQKEKVLFKDQDSFELIKNKFDINTLKPFDKVLVRDSDEDKWNIDFFSYYRNDGSYQCMTFTKNQCIPYEVNKKLLGTTDDCNEFYKTWEE